jgi:hypothetical protein
MTRLHDLAARFARGLLSNFLTLQTEGAGMPGARCTRGLVCNRHKKMRTRAYRAAEASDIPCAMDLRLISCSPRSGRARCHRRRRNGFHRLDASIGASGPHDFTVRIRTIRQRHIRVHRIPPRACDDRETPLVSGRDQIDLSLIWPRRQVNFGKSEISSGRGAVAWRPDRLGQSWLNKAGSTRLAQQA